MKKGPRRSPGRLASQNGLVRSANQATGSFNSRRLAVESNAFLSANMARRWWSVASGSAGIAADRSPALSNESCAMDQSSALV